MNNQPLKQAVKTYWNKASCGTEFIHEEKYSRAYFEAIEQFRYDIEPEIHAFAQFTRWHGKKILEVGVGAGTDFLQWARAGADAYGIDLTDEAIRNVKARLALYGLTAKPQQADAELLPFENNQFDLVYSWGVIHHSPDTQRCLEEIVRVTKPGGSIKLMLYNRRSPFAFYQYLIFGLLRGKPFQSIKTVLFNHQESPGTKAYTHKEIRAMVAGCPQVRLVQMRSPMSSHDLLYYKKNKVVRWLAAMVASFAGWQTAGWYIMIELKKN